MAIGANDLLEGHIDGEYLGKPPFELSVLPKALKIRVQS
jgi:diacylglycerol kinase family enzyme